MRPLLNGGTLGGRMEPSEAVESAWQVEDALAELSPECAATLAPSATHREILGLQATLGVTFPHDFVTSLLRHDGQHDPSKCFDFSGAGVLLSVNQIADTWQTMTLLASDLPELPGSGPWWKKTLVPFADAEGNLLCIDLDPTLPTHGEVVWHVHDGELESGIAASYAAWLHELAHRITSGGLALDEFGYPRLEPRF